MSDDDARRPVKQGPVVDADRAKGGRWGAPVFLVLVASLALAVGAYVLLHAAWFGADDAAERRMNSPPPAQERPQP